MRLIETKLEDEKVLGWVHKLYESEAINDYAYIEFMDGSLVNKNINNIQFLYPPGFKIEAKHIICYGCNELIKDIDECSQGFNYYTCRKRPCSEEVFHRYKNFEMEGLYNE